MITVTKKLTECSTIEIPQLVIEDLIMEFLEKAGHLPDAVSASDQDTVINWELNNFEGPEAVVSLTKVTWE